MQTTNATYRFVICVRNDGYPAALELRKIYQCLRDDRAEQHGHRRVIDESGEDYLYPRDYFIDVELPADVRQAVIRAA
jgi:hypothetical protein